MSLPEALSALGEYQRTGHDRAVQPGDLRDLVLLHRSYSERQDRLEAQWKERELEARPKHSIPECPEHPGQLIASCIECFPRNA